MSILLTSLRVLRYGIYLLKVDIEVDNGNVF